jgi:RNA polymerase sigma-70 factor, ECF subfamily
MSGAVGNGQIDEKWAGMMHAAVAGDQTIYRRLLEEIGRSVRTMARSAFARARAGDADVEDVVQETLLAIHLKRDTWDGGLRLAPWVAAIARHKIIDAMRRRGARRFPPTAAEDPHARSDAERLIAQLAPRQRDIVRSISLEGQSIAATAERLAMTEGAVRVALHRSLKALALAWRSATE